MVIAKVFAVVAVVVVPDVAMLEVMVLIVFELLSVNMLPMLVFK